MILWEQILLMVVGTLCAICGISLISDGILNAVDRYKTRRAQKGLKVYTEVMGKIPEVMSQTIQKMKELDK